MVFTRPKSKIAFTLLLVLSLPFSTVFIPLGLCSEDTWTTLKPMPTARNAFGVAVVDGKIYAIGGYNGTTLNVNEMYDPVTNTWTTKTSMPTARSGAAIAVVDKRIYVIGGNLGVEYTSVNEVYDTVTDTWETKTGIYGSLMTANVINGTLYLIGGVSSLWPPYPIINTIKTYNFTPDTWNTKTQLLTPVFAHSSVVVNNKIYILGGRNWTEPQEQDLTQIYDLETESWSKGKNIPTTVSGASVGVTSGVLAPKRIHLLDGDLHYIYDVENNSWSQASRISTRTGAKIAVVNDELYLIGGYYNENYLATNEKYTPVGYIPEFSSWVILLLFVVVGVVLVAFRWKVFRPT